MLKQLIISKKIEQRKVELAELLEQEKGLQKRSEELEAAIEEAQTDEELAVVEENINKLEEEKQHLAEQKSKLENEIAELENELEQLNNKAPQNMPTERSVKKNNEGGDLRMRKSKFFAGMEREAVLELINREDVKEFLTRTRELIKEKRAVTGAELTIPDVMLDLLRDNLYRYSKLINRVRIKTVNGKARQPIAGSVPEGVWTEAVGKLNELALGFRQVEVDAYKVGGFIPVPNSSF